jgi:hypothetical protein
MKMEEPTADVLDSAIPIADLAAGRSVLIRGPAMSGKYDLLLRLLGSLADRSILVSTSRQQRGARSDFENYGDPETFGVVDCASRVQGQDEGGGDLVRYASSPKNLTEVGVKFTDLVEQFQDDGDDPAAVGVHSVSELLMYAETEQVYQFLRVLLAEAQGMDWPAVAVVDDDAAGEQAVTTLSQPFDAVVTTRRDDEGQSFRYHDGAGDQSDWVPF